ncbi:MAG: oligosaccharide flippase family protein [Desulfarculaceae bacterium]|nr:oligosaccharide flippase family protein [Desulfarculaceae bacterium]
MSRKKTALISIFSNYVLIIINILSAFILVPYYLDYISVNLYGAWLSSGSLAVLIMIIDPGLSIVVLQKIAFHYGKNDLVEVGRLIKNGIVIAFLFGAAALCAGIITSFFLFDIVGIVDAANQPILKQGFIVAIIAASIMVVAYGVGGITLGLQASICPFSIHILTTIFCIFLQIKLLMCGYKILAIAYASLVMSLCLCVGNSLYMLWRIKKEAIPFEKGFSGIIELIKFGGFTFWSKIATEIAMNTDLILLNNFVGPKSSVALSTNRKALQGTQKFVTMISASMLASLSNLYGTGKIDRSKEIVLRLINIKIWLIGLFIIEFLLLNETFINLWIGNQYFVGQFNNLLIVLSTALLMLNVSMSNICFALGNIKGNSLAMMARTIIYLSTAVPATYFFGLPGLLISFIFAGTIANLWYFPKVIIERLSLSRTTIIITLIEASKVLASVVMIYLIFYSVTVVSILGFALCALAIATLYFLFAMVASANLRQELVVLYGSAQKALRKIKSID